MANRWGWEVAAALAAFVLAVPAAAAAAPSFRLESPAFQEGGTLPLRYTCGGNASTPPLRWSDPPAGTRSFALIFAEPVVGALRVHWVVYNIPAAARELPSKHVWRRREKDGTLQGRASGDRAGYSPPCPQPRHASPERFTLYALDSVLPDKLGYGAGDLAALMKGHVLARAELTAADAR